jgi:hypothetical protein
MLQIFPVVALRSEGQKVEVIFNREAPGSKSEGEKDEDDY